MGFSPQCLLIRMSPFLNKPKTLFFFFNFQVSDIDALYVLPTRGNMQTSRNWKRCLAIPKFPNVVIITIQDAMTSYKSVLKTARAVLLNLKVNTYKKSPRAPSFKKSGGFLMCFCCKTQQEMLCFLCVFSTCSHKEMRNKKIPKSLINLKDLQDCHGYQMLSQILWGVFRICTH